MSTLPDIATRLLLAPDEALGAGRCGAAHRQLDGENVKRQEEEAEILAAARKIVQTDPDVGAKTVYLVVARRGIASRRDWHRGVEARGCVH